jgi:hypothetical protein
MNLRICNFRTIQKLACPPLYKLYNIDEKGHGGGVPKYEPFPSLLQLSYDFEDIIEVEENLSNSPLPAAASSKDPSSTLKRSETRRCRPLIGQASLDWVEARGSRESLHKIQEEGEALRPRAYNSRKIKVVTFYNFI